ncbi:type I restriction endonuclease [Actinomycetospora sp. NBC_00405]|uniref:type I restriction endonuclease n=1 Tax=Actinomycetospora sp. NBC_00405 TaxID=2975952 RepID=UPI002E1E6414
MGIAERVQELSAKIRSQKAGIQTEEATKNAFVMPFISSVLGYDVFNPSEVVPEFTADVGTKKGEKIDYALVQGGEVQILIEVKKIAEPLRVEHASQLFRYFAVTHARVAILTNGEVYEFYTDLDAPNRMDDKPFLVLDLAAVDSTLLPEVAKLTRESFDVDSVISAAGELKYIGQIKRILAAEFKNPSDELVRFLAAQVYSGRSFTQRVREQFSPLVGKATNQFINEQVNTRLKTALGGNDATYDTTPVAQPAAPNSDPVGSTTDIADSDDGADRKGEVETTDEELEGYRVIKAIVCSEVAAARVIGRDSKTYFAVLLDDNNRKSIARLWFNRSKKYLGVFDENKVETRLPIESAEDIYRHADHLRATVASHLAKAA